VGHAKNGHFVVDFVLHGYFCRVVISVNRPMVEGHMEKLKTGSIKRLELSPDALKWTPLISSQCLLDEERSTEKEVSIALYYSKTSERYSENDLLLFLVLVFAVV